MVSFGRVISVFYAICSIVELKGAVHFYREGGGAVFFQQNLFTRKMTPSNSILLE